MRETIAAEKVDGGRMTERFECWDCGREEHFETIRDATEKGWTRTRTGEHMDRDGNPKDGEGFDLCPEHSSSERSIELITGVPHE